MINLIDDWNNFVRLIMGELRDVYAIHLVLKICQILIGIWGPLVPVVSNRRDLSF